MHCTSTPNVNQEPNYMKRELRIARCLCSENEHCQGCNSGVCPDKEWCENRSCSIRKNIKNCFLCGTDCRKGLLAKIMPYGFTLFAKRYGIEKLLNCLEENEKNGVIYHRHGIVGDYDNFDNVEELIHFIQTGKK